MKTKKNEHAGVVIVASLLLALPFAAWYGFAVKTLWGWFAVPLGAVQIHLWEAAGLYLLARLLTNQVDASANDDREPLEKFATSLATSLLVPALALLFGAIYHGLA